MASNKSIMRFVDETTGLMECPVCGARHFALLARGGKRRRGYKMCPKGCERGGKPTQG